MKKRNIGICIITTTLLMGGPAKATELILAKDHTNVVNQAAEIAAYKSNRPPVNKRLFTSKAVEAEIIRVKKLLTNQKLAWMFENCFPNTLETTVHYRTTDGKPDTFVYTGDIHAMWLRDSGAQVWPYVQLANKDPELKKMLEGVIRRQFKCINIDPYANAFNDGAVGGEWMSDLTDMKPELHERKWEIDSLCYPLRLAYQYWKETGDASIFDSEWIQAITNILTTFKEQQRKEGVGPYKFQRKTERALDTINNNGLGAPVNPVGLIVSAFRPSDDATTLQFLVPSNFFAVSSLKKAAEILNAVNQNAELAKQCTDLAKEVEVRNINSITIVPERIYQEKKEVFDVGIEFLSKPNIGRETRSLIKSKLQDLTLSLPIYQKFPEKVDKKIIGNGRKRKVMDIHRSTYKYEFEFETGKGMGLIMQEELETDGEFI